MRQSNKSTQTHLLGFDGLRKSIIFIGDLKLCRVRGWRVTQKCVWYIDMKKIADVPSAMELPFHRSLLLMPTKMMCRFLSFRCQGHGEFESVYTTRARVRLLLKNSKVLSQSSFTDSSNVSCLSALELSVVILRKPWLRLLRLIQMILIRFHPMQSLYPNTVSLLRRRTHHYRRYPSYHNIHQRDEKSRKSPMVYNEKYQRQSSGDC